tara:strand:+ start:4156 stop:4734 length:579 start_codon:yes stop_codon:yes gene_type:complete
LITDKRLADFLSCQNSLRDNDERLLIVEHETGLDLSLYISFDVMKHLEDAHPLELLEEGKYSEFCLMLEGVSHFLYVIWNASHQKKVTLLEMELQAEIDKFIMMTSLLDDECCRDDINCLQKWLFEKNSFDAMLTESELERYKQANYYAGKYCMNLQQQYKLQGLNNGLLKELRRFYRLVQEDKMRYINRLH